tara:strand:+ start:595 stop:1299 length:705 start_codon:yes stop_codon:yes gene_type:complete
MKNIIVTGGSSGIGEAIIKKFENEKINMINMDIKKNLHNTYKTNLNKSSDIKKNFLKIQNKFKTIHGLVNCAAITIPGNSFKYNLNDWNKTLMINLTAPFILCQLVANNMLKYKTKGSILNVTSIGAEQAFPENPAYQASKAALKHLTKALALDFASKNIRVNSIAPGYTKTSMNKNSWNDKKKRNDRAKKTLLNRWANPNEIAEAVYFLISEKSSYITGSNLIVDGGWTSKGL